MITTHHKIKERIKVVKESEGEMTLRIRRTTDGYYFNVDTHQFEEFNALSNYDFELIPFFGSESLSTVALLTLPTVAQDLIFEFTDTVVDDEEESTTVSFERHIFGGVEFVDSPATCLVYGTLIDVTGSPLVGQKVEAYLNRAGYFVHKAGLIGYAATALTDESGYFSIPLIRGIDVTISVPVTGFSTRGYVPNATSVELTSHTLLSYLPGA